jgi:23S rRNA (uridine2552-2'-O)-methyltransferase
VRRWNDDPFTQKARRENYEARSVYKLEEIDQRERILRGASVILDLGASPGSWTQYCLKKAPKAKVIAVDLNPLNFSHPQVTFLQQSVEDLEIGPLVDGKVDLVLSDMAPKTSGIHDRDVYLSFELASLALNQATHHLKKGGHFVAKLFMGESFEEFQKLLKIHFEQVKLIRPESTRKHSREIFCVGKQYRGLILLKDS